MLEFEITLNGRKARSVKKSARYGIFTAAIFSRARYGEGAVLHEAAGLQVSEFDSEGRQRLVHIDRKLRAGDEITIRITDAASFARPQNRSHPRRLRKTSPKKPD